MYKLWDSLLDGSAKTLKLSWIPRDLSAAARDTEFIRWVEANHHTALMVAALPWVCDRWNTPGDDGSTIMEKLLRLVPDSVIDNVIDVQSMRDKNLLINAATYGQLATIQFLLRIGVDVNVRSPSTYSSTALIAAIQNRHNAIAEFLVNKGADVNARVGITGPPLHTAVMIGGMENVVKLLVENGADVNATGGSHGTALSAATWALWQRLFAPGEADDRYPRPLDTLSTMKVLLKAGADVHEYKSNSVGRCSPLGQVAGTPCRTADSGELVGMAVRVLIEAGAEINGPCNSEDERPGQVAARWRNEPFLKAILYNVDIHHKLKSWKAYEKKYKTTEAIARLLYEAADPHQAGTRITNH